MGAVEPTRWAKDRYEKPIMVIVAGGRLSSPSLPEECKRAIQTRGRSAVKAVLNQAHPPDIILVTTAGLREQPPPIDDPPDVGKSVTCGECGRVLPERSDLTPEKRPPCPECGSTSRKFLVHLEAQITGRGSLNAKLVLEAIPPPDDGQSVTSDLLEAGYIVRWWSYPDGLVLVQVIDETTGELLDAGGGDSPVDALLEIAEKLLPPKHPEAPGGSS